MSQQTPPVFATEIDTICLQLYERQFAAMERSVIQLVELMLRVPCDVVANNEKSYAVYILLHAFNQYYVRWLERNGHKVYKETEDLSSLEHDNYLLAYCQNVHAMEALLKQLWVSLNTSPGVIPVDSAVRWYRERYLG